MKKSLLGIFIITIIIFLMLFTKDYLRNIYNNYTNDSLDLVIEQNDYTKIEDTVNEEHIINENDINEEVLYKTMEQGLLNMDEKIKIDDNLICNSIDEIFTATINKITRENPNIMYLKGGKYSNGYFSPEYSKPKEEIQLHKNKIEYKRDEIILKLIRPNMSEYEKVKTIHDYIINNSNYDKRYLKDEKIPEESYSVYGVLINRIGVCEGYAKTMKYLLDAAGIKSMVIRGKSKGVGHAWNIVNIEGDCYNVDATWDDPLTESGKDMLIYDYFNLTDEEIGKDHTWNRDDYPVCNSSKYNYHYYNDLIANDYNDFLNKLKIAIDNKHSSIEIKVLNFEKNEYNISNIINNISNNSLKGPQVKEYEYSINSIHGIVRINFYYYN